MNFVVFGLIYLIIHTIVYVYFDSKSWEPYSKGQMRETTYRPKGSEVGSETNLSHAAMFMNIDE
jgi:hypothetical protein